MARKAKRKPAARRRQQARGGPGAALPAAPAGVPTAGVATARVGGDQATVRAVEMSLAPRAAARGRGRLVLEGGDPAIPLDRVPYFTADLRKLGLVALLMVVLLVAGAQVIPLVVR